MNASTYVQKYTTRMQRLIPSIHWIRLGSREFGSGRIQIQIWCYLQLMLCLH